MSLPAQRYPLPFFTWVLPISISPPFFIIKQTVIAKVTAKKEKKYKWYKQYLLVHKGILSLQWNNRKDIDANKQKCSQSVHFKLFLCTFPFRNFTFSSPFHPSDKTFITELSINIFHFIHYPMIILFIIILFLHFIIMLITPVIFKWKKGTSLKVLIKIFIFPYI